MRKAYFFVLFVFVFLTSCVHTEVEVNGDVSGVIKEKSTAVPLRNCKVILDDGESYVTTTDSVGKYYLKAVKMGSHVITVVKEGFHEYHDSILVQSGKVLSFDVFMVAKQKPTVQTLNAQNISHDGATLMGHIISDGGGSIKENGFYFGVSLENRSKLFVDKHDSVYSFEVKNLKDGIVCGYSAFASNEVGESEGKWITFQTSSLTLPEVVTKTPTAIEGNSATLEGEISSIGNSDLLDYGFYIRTLDSEYSTYSSNNLNNNYFSREVTTLIPNTTYFYKAFAKNLKGETAGVEVSFSTKRVDLASFSELAISDTTYTSITASCEILDDGGSLIVERGFCYAIKPQPTIEDNNVAVGQGKGSFSTSIQGLSEGSQYYLRAYAKNSVGVAYSAQCSFSTLSKDKATVITNEAQNVEYTSAKVGGNITNDGGFSVSERGVCFSLNSNPSISDSKLSAGNGTGQFWCDLFGLNEGTTYYVRAYAINLKGTSYGQQISFKTLKHTLPNVSTLQYENLKATSATISSEVISDGGYPVTERGVCYSTSQDPTITGSRVVVGKGVGSYIANLTDLTEGATYYVRAYATNQLGTAYGQQLSFATIAEALPTVTTYEASNISYTSATLRGSVTNNGGGTITDRGICYSTSQNPTISSSKIAIGSGTGSFSGSITNLSENTTYYARAYATNSKGTAYGFQVSFKTNAYTTPSVSTLDALDIKTTSATISGNVADDGGQSVTEKGFYYSTNNTPQTSGTKIMVSEAGIGSYSTSLTNLVTNTTYYFIAYAKNNMGTSFGSVISFKTADAYNGHTYVDLGLSVKWATLNIGADSPESYGDYYSWGEITTKESYDWSNYVITQYDILHDPFGIYNTLRRNNGLYDTAHELWDGSWRMPTNNEITELINNCNWEWTTRNGVNGYKITGNNGNSIFLPAGGYAQPFSIGGIPAGSIGWIGSQCKYWSSEVNYSDKLEARCLYFTSTAKSASTHSRAGAALIRPVCP